MRIPTSSTPRADAVAGFVLRWVGRIVFWGALAILALIGVAMLAAWAEENPQRWQGVVIAGLLSAAVWMLNEIRRLLARIADQNGDIIRALRNPPRPRDPFDD